MRITQTELGTQIDFRYSYACLFERNGKAAWPWLFLMLLIGKILTLRIFVQFCKPVPSDKGIFIADPKNFYVIGAYALHWHFSKWQTISCLKAMTKEQLAAFRGPINIKFRETNEGE